MTKGSHLLFNTEVRWLTFSLIFMSSSLTAFRRRTNEEHRQLGDSYLQQPNPTARKNFVKQHATRYCQLSRLPYFNLVQQIVVDPMHNLFLGQSSFPPCSSVLIPVIPHRPCQDSLLRDMGPTEDLTPNSRARRISFNT